MLVKNYDAYQILFYSYLRLYNFGRSDVNKLVVQLNTTDIWFIKQCFGYICMQLLCNSDALFAIP